MLEIEEDQPFQEKLWMIQRIGWCLLIIFLTAAALGYTGPSSLTTVVEEKGGYRIEYPRFGRIGTEFKLLVAGPGGEVLLSREILAKNAVTRMVPRPEGAEARPEGTVFRFTGGEGGEIYIDLKPRSAGRLRGRVGLGNPAAEFEVSQLVYF